VAVASPQMRPVAESRPRRHRWRQRAQGAGQRRMRTSTLVPFATSRNGVIARPFFRLRAPPHSARAAAKSDGEVFSREWRGEARIQAARTSRSAPGNFGLRRQGGGGSFAGHDFFAPSARFDSRATRI